MFTIPVGDLLSSYEGDNKNFSFDGEIFDGFFDDLSFTEPLTFDIKLIGLDDSVQGLFSNLKAHIVYEWKKQKIHIAEFDRLWKTRRDPLDPDDIYAVNTKNMTIDLAPVIREEIIMAFHNENM